MDFFVPKRDTTHFNMYVNTKIIKKTFSDEEQGSYIEGEGLAAVFYKYPDYRRAYLIAPPDGNNDNLMEIKNVEQDCRVLYMATARRFDLLKRMIFNMEKEWGKDIWLMPADIWTKLSCLLDKFNGKESMVNYANIMYIAGDYLKEIKK